MSSSSISSSRFPRISTHGVPSRCWCGEGITTFASSTTENRYRRFYRCEVAIHKKSENHLFKWIDEALLDEIREVDAKHDRVSRRLARVEHEMTQKMNEKVTLEIARVEHEMTQKMNEKVIVEIARVQEEIQKKLKIATVAMVLVGAIAVMWTSHTV
ncbi:uncharacterized protein At4g04775-like [Raphanus sativus]|uniref:Uncharacterized protein At4g04775-like n=1 Tax=Raphanus sativus TaxID=3726 RepID=A0A6J0M7N1_RAPSA|nr:uncharacterized protein At4g04775-like [Raphanus sativus]XP_056860258.1 uncharacterized protein At4g04775-like [Raphanus sativus]